MDELSMIVELLPTQEPPPPATVEAAYSRFAALTAAAGSAPAASQRIGPARRLRTTAWVAGISAVAATAAAVTVYAARSGPGTRPPGQVAQPRSARAVLLAAAEQISSSQAAGTYWAIRVFDDRLFPAGTKAHPYDVYLRRRFDIWRAAAAGRPGFSISQQLTARLATAADLAAWRAAGSPSTWVMQGGTWSLTRPVPHSTFAGTDTQPGCDLGYGHVTEITLTTARCLRLPETAAGLRAVLLPYAERYVRGTHRGASGLTLDEWIAYGAYKILIDPVRPRTDAAALRLLADYPGMRLIAKVRDPLGRTGYALALGFQGQESEFIINPATGQLLATRRIYTKASQWLRQGWPGFYGRPWYPGMVAEWTIIRQMGWTDAAPPE